jgi:hypothetical protein
MTARLPIPSAMARLERPNMLYICEGAMSCECERHRLMMQIHKG